ncbi:MAG TPA: carboxypeptidase-like regulatory domain-containing protein [Bacteroidota bacterium]|nr:carboxypeptidase-like regulatory domain-containing protein [Bacteroidota bacterium]
MYRSLFPLIALIALAHSAGGFPRGAGGSVQGTVRDAATGAPLENTNVYLSATTLGTATDSAGRFTLRNIPPGVYQVVASRVGYRIASRTVNVADGAALRVDLKIEALEIRGEEVQVFARVDTEWRRMLKDFLKAFLGEGANAGECAILNPEVMDFREDSASAILLASTDSVLRIENRALGYMLYARLGLFEWDLQEDRGRFILYPEFVPLRARDSAEEADWRAHRARSYDGSLRDFLSSLVAGKADERRFIIRTGTLAELQTGRSHPLAPDDIRIAPVPGQRFWRLVFDAWLRVDHPRDNERHRSFIRLGTQPAVIDAAGNPVDPLTMEVIGDWTKYRVADMLPLNYTGGL